MAGHNIPDRLRAKGALETCRKERSKRPHQSKRPGVPKIAKTEQTPRGDLIYFILIKTLRGVLSRAFPRGRPLGASPRHEKVCEKDLLPRKGLLIRVPFFVFIFIHHLKLFFLDLSRPVDSTRRPDQLFFSLWKRPGGAFCPIFVLKNAPEHYFGIVLWNAPGGVYSVLYGILHPELDKSCDDACRIVQLSMFKVFGR